MDVPADHKEILKESEKRDEYLCLVKKKSKKKATKIKNLWNRKVIVILIVIGTLGTISKRFVQRLEDL